MNFRFFFLGLLVFFSVFLGGEKLFAQEAALNFDINSLAGPVNFSSTTSLLVALSSISLVPFFLISTTCFLRIAIIMSMIRNALGTQQSPPNPVLVALTLFMTIFVMSTTFQEVYTKAIKPYQDKKITQEQAITRGMEPFRVFMLKFTREKDLALFMEFSGLKQITNSKDVPIYVLIPAFIISELKTAFQISFIIFIPFIVVDLVVSNILLSLGMFMLSPVMISLPFKILLFVLTDGWNLIIRGILTSYRI